MSDDVDLAHCIEVAVGHALRQPWIPGPQDREERRSVAMCAAWEASVRTDQDRPAHEIDSYVRRVVRSRLIDAERASRGRLGTNGARGLRERPLALIEGADGSCTDADEVVVADMVRWLARGDRRTEVILSGLAAGERRQDIAERIGVSPGRVTQIVAQVRDGDRLAELVVA